MEFMDRRGDMVKLQFWLIVEGFHSTEAKTPHERMTFLQDVKMVYEMYFTETAPHRLHVLDQLNTDLIHTIQLAEKAKNEELFEEHIRELRLHLYRIQQHIFWEIEKEHFPYFKRSDLYFKFLSSGPAVTIPEEKRRSFDDSTINLKIDTDNTRSTRGHHRALSDSTQTTPTNPNNKFISLSNLLSSPTEISQTSLSVPASIKSIETDDEFINEENLGSTNKRNRLIRSNTVDAVEAELRSILDGKNNLDMSSNNNNIKPISSTSSALLLCGTKGIKSTKAVPVENAYTLPSWTSSGGTNTISEIEHDSLESFVSTKSAGSNKTSIEDSTQDLTSSSTSTTNIHFAPPGDLMLASKVEQLAEEVEKLTAQEAIVDALISKAESQNKLGELRILKKSKSMFRQELQQIKYQKSQYQLQESENVLMPDRSKLNITSATIGSDKNGDFALYVIEIQQLGFDGNFGSGWIVARRYSEFFALHQKLKEIYPAVKVIEFPGKWPLLKLQKPFVEARRVSLEKYLRSLVKDKEICQSQEFKSFLSQQNIFVPGPDTEWPFGSLFGGSTTHSTAVNAANANTVHAGTDTVPLPTSSSSSSLHSITSPSIQNLQKSMAAAGVDESTQKKQSKGFMRHIYKTVAAGIDDILVGPSMLDLITQRLGEQVMEFSNEEDNNKSSTPASSSSSRSNNKLSESTELPDSLKAEGITRFTEPLCDLFIEMFELKDKTNWLRRQAVVIILQQILEGTIER